MVTWTQMYMPMGGLGLSALVALIPIIFFFVALAVLRLKEAIRASVNQLYWLALACWRLRVKECVLCAAVWLTR
ncbi:L-lactate permease [Escherichia coli]|nr:L-lactate permease [Escherichia coli]